MTNPLKTHGFADSLSGVEVFQLRMALMARIERVNQVYTTDLAVRERQLDVIRSLITTLGLEPEFFFPSEI